MEGMQHTVLGGPSLPLCPGLLSFRAPVTLNVHTPVLPRRSYVRAKVQSECSLCPTAQSWAWPTGGTWVTGVEERKGGKEQRREERAGDDPA